MSCCARWLLVGTLIAPAAPAIAYPDLATLPVQPNSCTIMAPGGFSVWLEKKSGQDRLIGTAIMYLTGSNGSRLEVSFTEDMRPGSYYLDDLAVFGFAFSLPNQIVNPAVASLDYKISFDGKPYVPSEFDRISVHRTYSASAKSEVRVSLSNATKLIGTGSEPLKKAGLMIKLNYQDNLIASSSYKGAEIAAAADYARTAWAKARVAARQGNCVPMGA